MENEAKKDVSEIEEVGEAAIELGVATATLPLKKTFWHRVFVAAAVAIVGYVLLELRFHFFKSVPFLKAMTQFVAFTWDTFLKFIDLFRPVLTLLNDVFGAFFRLLNTLIPSGIMDGAKILITLLSTNLRTLRLLLMLDGDDDSFDADTVTDVMDDIVKNCSPLTDGWFIIGELIRAQLHGRLCPAARYLYPVPWLYAAYTYLFGSLYKGSAEPIVNHYAEPGKYNCEGDKHFGALSLPSQTCTIVGSGFVVLEVVVPFFVVLIFAQIFPYLSKFLKKTVKFIFSLAWILVERLLKQIIRYAL